MRPLRLILFLAMFSTAASAAEPNLVLVTIDTARADRFGFLGSERGLTPNLDALAKQSLVFTHAYAQAPLTTVSHATILTGTHPPYHRVNDFGISIPAPIPTVAELLKARGYQTAALTCTTPATSDAERVTIGLRRWSGVQSRWCSGR